MDYGAEAIIFLGEAFDDSLEEPDSADDRRGGGAIGGDF